MTKCGLLIPADEKSNVMIYDKVCCDIGDDQSIQANLSTFSSHMVNIINIIEELIERYAGNESLWFMVQPNSQIAVKIVDDRGIESLKVIRIGDE